MLPDIFGFHATGLESLVADAVVITPGDTSDLAAPMAPHLGTGWSVSGDIGRIVVAAIPAISVPAATGSAGPLTITA